MVYGVSGQRIACAVIIVIYHDGISIVHVLSQVLRSCTELYRCREPFLCPPRAVPLDLQSNRFLGSLRPRLSMGGNYSIP